MKQNKGFTLSKNAAARASQIEKLYECAVYLVDSERDDFEEYIAQAGEPNLHIFRSAYVALYGLNQFNTLVQELQRIS